MSKLPKKPKAEIEERSEVDAFLQKVANTPPPVVADTQRKRLVFALDATASREHTWNRAKDLQAQMFAQAEACGGLQIQLCYYRGFADFHASSWHRQSAELLRAMSNVDCIGGLTQIGKVLKHVARETRVRPIACVVFVGDAMEEDVDQLCRTAGELGLLGVRVFLFQEGHDVGATRAFRQIAKLTRGAHCKFDASSATELRDLLSAVAAYAAGGLDALKKLDNRAGGQTKALVRQVGHD